MIKKEVKLISPLILNTKGESNSEVWFVGENDGELPNSYPAGWKTKAMVYMIDRYTHST